MPSLPAVILAIMLIFCVFEPAEAKLADEIFKTRGLKLLHQNLNGLLSNFHAIQGRKSKKLLGGCHEVGPKGIGLCVPKSAPT